MDKHNDRLEEFLHRPERPAVLLDTSGGLSLGPLPGLEDFSKTIPGLLSCLDAGFLKVRQVTQSPDLEGAMPQLFWSSQPGSLIEAIEPTSSHEIGFEGSLHYDGSEYG
jgi:hypothetical protein